MKNFQAKPLVSVIMPVRNAEAFLRDSLESIFRQTYQNFEVLLVDDASTDGTRQILKEYKERFKGRTKIFCLGGQRGAFGATNFAYPKARGEFIALMDGDDISHPQRFKKQVEYLKNHRSVIVLGTQANIIDGEGNLVGKKMVPASHDEIYKQFALVHPMIHPSCMIQRNLLPNKKAIYEDRFGVNDDYFTFFKLLNCGVFANLPEFLLDYRIHGKNSSLQDIKKLFFNTLKIRITAAQEFGYKFSIKAKMAVVLQLFLVVLMPTKILFPLYLAIRGRKSFFSIFIKTIFKSIRVLIPIKQRLPWEFLQG